MKPLLLLALLLPAGQATAQTASNDAMPEKGYVPDAATAVAVAEAVLRPIYAQHGWKLQNCQPLAATLRNDSVWVVRKRRPGKGGPYAEISKATGCILVAEARK
ncbi:hypothetical protein GCM10023185_12800 [Hymenobacter saemangeumensis]|uniref:NTF2 fold domain-containing protein n=1 Tax=Hymenobacter saemangeumensis TaxID=1084522 RepID=A0ABP8I7E7_9BACT